MVERKRSKDGVKETEQFRQPEVGGGPGRAGGNLARDVGTQDDLKRAHEQPAGITRETKSDEKPRSGKKNSER